MKVSMNGLRRNLARAFNCAARDRSDENLDQLRQHIGILLSVYDDEIEGDMDDLSESVHLTEIFP
jgi:hypothetical protein